MTYILASGSPRRREICALAGIPVEIVPAPAGAEPLLTPDLPPEEAAILSAKAKALAVAATRPDRTVIGADTSVWLPDRPLGKPRDREEAAAMLRSLSGRTHRVITGVWVWGPGGGDGFADVAEVEFYPLTEEEIAAYIATGEPMDKAGAYGIQGKGMALIRGISGDFYTVMGLPGARLLRFLRNFEKS